MLRATILSLLMLAPFAAAQADEGACTQTAPCEWIVDVDASGFGSTGFDDVAYNGTVGDWYIFSIFNADDVQHTLSWPDYGLSWVVPAADVLDTEPFQLTQEGQFFLNDAPSGDTATINVFLGDVVDEEDRAAGEDGGEKSQPGVGIVLLAVGLLVLVAVRRR